MTYSKPENEISLYKDQLEVIQGVRSNWSKYKQMLVYAATGFGKTRLSAYIINGLISNGLKVCFVVPRISLIKQTAESFTNLGITDISFIWGDEEHNSSSSVTIASAQTLLRREHKEFDLIINDECDLKFKELLVRMANDTDQRYIGLTATPFAPWLGNYYKKMIKSKSMKWLIEHGRLSAYDVYVPTKPDLKKVSINYGEDTDYNQTELADVMCGAQVVGDVVGNWLEHGENRTTMVLTVNKSHAGFITNEFVRSGITAEIITSDTPIEEREEIFYRVKNRITLVVVSIETLTQGFDMPEVTCLINARPTKSKRRFTQGIGRALRTMDNISEYNEKYLAKTKLINGPIKALFKLEDIKDLERVKQVILNNHIDNGDTLIFSDQDIKADIVVPVAKLKKRDAVIFDHSGSFIEHGLVEDITVDYLLSDESGLEEKVKQFKDQEKPEKKAKECKKCHYMKPAGIYKCPKCGHKPLAGEDVEADETRTLKKMGKESVATQEEKHSFYNGLLGWQIEQRNKGKHIKDGAISHKFRDKFGHWPHHSYPRSPQEPSQEVRNFIKYQAIKWAKGRK